MEIKCEKCGSTNIVQGKLVSGYAVTFVPINQKGAIKQSSPVLACACKDCGNIFNIRLENPLIYNVR